MTFDPPLIINWNNYSQTATIRASITKKMFTFLFNKWNFELKTDWNQNAPNCSFFVNTLCTFSDWQPFFFVDVIVAKSLEKLLGSDVQRFCQPDELWQGKRTNGETGRIVLEDNPVWWAEDQNSWFANFCMALESPWNDTTDCKQQQTCRQRRGPAVGGCAGCKVHFRLMT